MSHFSRWPGAANDGDPQDGDPDRYRARHRADDADGDWDDVEPIDDDVYGETHAFASPGEAAGDGHHDVADGDDEYADDGYVVHEDDGYDDYDDGDGYDDEYADDERPVDGKLLRRSLLILAATLVAMIAWTWHSVTTMYRESTAAVASLSDLNASPDRLDDTRTLLTASSRHAAKARAAADALPLRVLSRLPFFGDDVLAARTLTTSLDTVVTKAGLPLVDLGNDLLTPPDTRPGTPKPLVNTAPLPGAPAIVETAAVTVRSAHNELKAIDTSSIDRRLAGPVVEARRLMAQADTSLTQAYDYAPLLPSLLGADKPRDYLLAFQNLAEARPTGGIIGKWALVRVNKGSVQLLETGANENLVDLSLKATPQMPADFMALYGQSLGPVANANLTPSFPDASKLMLATWREQGRPMPAGVVSVDTVGISRILGLTGPLTVPGPNGTVVVGAENVVEVVQARVYEWFEDDEEARQRFLSALTDEMVKQLTTKDVPLRNLATTMASMATDRQVMAYSTVPAEQDALVKLKAAYELPTPTPGQAMVFLTDNGGSKLDQYLKVSTCSASGALGLRLTNELPAGYRTQLPDYVLNQRRGANKGTNQITAAFYLPAGRGLASVTVDGRPTSVAIGSERGWSVARVPLDVPQGRSLTVKANLSGKGVVPALTTQSLTHTVTSLNGVCGK